MGAKQSKRSVDISGKEAESAGEVAAAGAGGEGRVEALADADALKPQANGAAHIHEQTDKEKQLDSGTPENEKDATTEKETKEEGEGEKDEAKPNAPATNGDAETKPENGDSSPAVEDGKKPKKEKVKKKWSLRSISFSRKDKPKQEKKQKEEEPKTNGEPEKVPEEAAEVTPENAANEVAEEVKPEKVVEEKTPETPVTEPLTNGSSTPESPKVESPSTADPAPPTAPATALAPVGPETDRAERKAEVQLEQLPINGLSLEEQKSEAPIQKREESKPEEPAADMTETAPAPEIPVKIEVCVEQMPLEITPPPLPANPPPSSVASFAASTMAPELTDASLANTAELVTSAQSVASAPDCPLEAASAPSAQLTDNNTITVATEFSPPLKESVDAEPIENVKPQIVNVIETIEFQPASVPEDAANTEIKTVEPIIEIEEPIVETVEPVVENVDSVLGKSKPDSQLAIAQVQLETDASDSVIEKDISEAACTTPGNISCPESNVDTFETVKNQVALVENSSVMKLESPEEEMPPAPIIPDDLEIPEHALDSPDTIDYLPPPPPPIEEEISALKEQTEVEEQTMLLEENINETKVNSNHISESTEINELNTEQLNGNVDTEQKNLKNKSKDSLGNFIDAVECNGNVEAQTRPVEAMDVSPSGEDAGHAPPAAAASPATPASPRADPPQEPVPVSDKLADLIPEIPVLPELNTQTETSSDVAVAN